MEVTSASQWDPRSDSLPAQYRSQDVSQDSYLEHSYQSDAGSQQQYAADSHPGSVGNSVVYGQPNGLGVPSYRQHSPGGGQFGSSPGYRVNGGGYSGHNSVDAAGMPHPRQASISSVSSTDYGTSPTMSHAGSRNNSIYSLDGQMGNLGMTSAGVDPATGQPLYSNGLARYPGSVNGGLVDRRFSLDERSRPPSGNAAAKPSNLAAPSGRSWPWGASNQNGPMHGRASYDYGGPTARAASGSYPTGYETFQHGPNMADMPSRLRSMSSSAIGGRSHPYGYPGAGSAAGAAAAMGLVPPGDMLQMDAHGHPIQGVGLVGPQVGPGGGATRRAKFKRSRTGCLVCRKRKVKCSQDGTPCKQCRIGKRDCYYDDNPPKRKRKGKNGTSGTATSGDGSASDSAKPGTTNGGFTKPHAAPGSGSYDSYPQLPPPPGVAFSMPFGQSHSHHHSHAGHGGADAAAGFGSSGWPLASGEAHSRGGFDAGGLPPDTHDTQRGSFGGSVYDHRGSSLSQSHHHASNGLGGHGHTVASNGGWYDPVTEQHSRPLYGSEAAAAHS